MTPRTPRHYHAAIVAALTGACSTQVAHAPCVSNADCAFADTPGCLAGVCTATGTVTGPQGCVSGQPHTALDVANQCTTARFYPFDNCTRLRLCDPGALAAAFGLTIAPPAQQPPPIIVPPAPTVRCADVSPSVIYLTGSPDLAPVIRAVQPMLSRAPSGPTAVFFPQTSCLGAAAIYDPSPAKHVIMNGNFLWPFYYDASGAQNFCLLDPAGQTVDIGESDVDPSACGYAPVANVADYPGPIRTASFVVSPPSAEQTISAEAAHLMFAAGGDRGLTAPWTDPASYFLGGAETIRVASPAIGAAPDGWWGTLLSPTGAFAALAEIDPARFESAIGLLSGDALARLGRGTLRELPFQRQRQLAGFLPDSFPGALDKANVRDGHYSIWSAMHFFTSTAAGVPAPAASAFLLQLVTARLDQALLSSLIDAGFIPACAMKVVQSPDGPVPFAPPLDCGCFYDRQATGHSTCHACATASDCSLSAPACNYGYCEAR
jgi:hypothetical protein